MKTRLKFAATACIVAGTLGAGNARAQGIPVIDIANLIQTLLQVLNDVTEIQNQVQQITQLQTQVNSMVYNCMDLTGGARTSCQAALAQPYQQKGLLQDAMKSAAGRLSQIQSLMGQINATSDQKAVQEVQARIGAENALLAHEMSQVQMLQGMADSEERIARSRDRERQHQMLARTGKVASYLP